ncbi:ATP-NAD kinase-like domain-containing protein [Gaertneriomyces semiglobifer]|nr:ATP-NAD kinase-like domain-containing protein [Gaertneriomyces semiglobifer]
MATTPTGQQERCGQKPSHWRIIINPVSGKGTGGKIGDTIRETLTGAGWAETVDVSSNGQVTFSCTRTQRTGHASVIANSWALEGLFNNSNVGICCVGGDGVVHEVINGIMAAGISNDVCISICVVPAGTGNALATTYGIRSAEDAICRLVSLYAPPSAEAGEPPVSTKPVLTPLRISSVHVGPLPVDTATTWTWNEACPKQIVQYAFCVVSWGLHAEIVRQSDKIRWLGFKRFLATAVANVFMHYHYKARLHVLQPTLLDQAKAEESFTAEGTDVFITPAWAATDPDVLVAFNGNDAVHEYDYFVATKTTHLDPTFHPTRYSDPSDPTMSLLSLPRSSRSQVMDFLSNTPAIPRAASYLKVHGFVLTPEAATGRVTKDAKGNRTEVHDICVDGEMIEVPQGESLWVRTVSTSNAPKFWLLH